jgi:hypothetical protein
MSAGIFQIYTYEDQNGVKYPIRLQPETLTTLIIGGTTGTRQAGVYPRKIGIRFTGAGPTGYKAGSTHYVVVPDPDVFASFTNPRAQTGTYLGAACVVIGTSPERL